jgi:3-phosphoshikimate 1-carboxyvinyltransferase
MTGGGTARSAISCAPATGPLRGTVRLPGDKSITHRALLFAALAEGESTIRGANSGRDCRAMARALTRLGVQLEAKRDDAGAPTEWRVRGSAGALGEARDLLDCGNSGTALRLLAGAVSAGDRFSILDGDASIRRRPMRRIVEPLVRMGARIDGPDGTSHCPLAVRGGALRGIEHRSEVSSAQVKSCLLIAGLGASGETWVHEPRESRDHTERLLPAFGATLLRRTPVAPDRGAASVGVRGGQRLHAAEIDVPADFSAAAFWIVAASIVPGSELAMSDVGLNPSRTGLARALQRMGADLRFEETGTRAGEPVGTVRVRARELRATDIAVEEVASLIDEIPVWALAAACASGVSRVRGAAELRVKESDRLAEVSRGLRVLGVPVVEHPDGLEIEGRGGTGSYPLAGGRLRAAGDHRLAMTWIVAGLASKRPVQVSGAAMVDTSYPGFYSTFVAMSSCR